MDRLRIDDNGHGIWLGDKHIPWAQVWTQTLNNGVGTFEMRRATVAFENGLTLSIAWGTAMHGDNYDHDMNGGPFIEEPRLVECAVIPRDVDRPRVGELLTFEATGDTIFGYATMCEVRDMVDAIAEMPSTEQVVRFPAVNR